LVSFALPGLAHFAGETQGLRPGLHSYAASRLLYAAGLAVAHFKTRPSKLAHISVQKPGPAAQGR